MPEVRLDTLAAIRGKHALWCYRLTCKREKPPDLATKLFADVQIGITIRSLGVAPGRSAFGQKRPVR